MIELLFKAGPWIAVVLAGLFAAVTHINAKAKVATANQKVAEAQTTAAQAQTQTAEVRDAEAQANAVAAQAGAQALKERTNVENDVAALPGGAAQQRLRDEWSKPSEDAGRGASGAGQDPNR
ncbi:hypothetical protein [Paraburkholderia dilworthii]|uniref:Rz protein n=1 Tax=Paraburkholderia dilworthii TaxID=948106 RepID=A0ABW9D940_9BURK